MIFSCPKCGTQYEIEESGHYECKCGNEFDVEVQKPIPARPILKAVQKSSTFSENQKKTTENAASPQSDALSDADTRICPFCGETIKKTATICRFCHNTLSQMITMCKECGTFFKFSPEDQGKRMTCPMCGEPIQVEPTEFRQCPACGETIKIGAKVCKFCHESLPPLKVIDPRAPHNAKTSVSSNGALPVSDPALKDKMSRMWGNLKIWSILLLCSLAVGEILEPLLFFTVVALVFYCIYLYQLMECYWRYIGPEKGYTSGQMAGFLFIPLFHLYWYFFCYGNLVRKIKATGSDVVNESTATMFCISNIIALIPVVGPLLNLVMFYVMHSQLNRAFVGEQ